MKKLGWVAALCFVPISCGPPRTYRSEQGEPLGAGRAEAKYVLKASSSADWCDYCNVYAYAYHRCGRTVPCALCKREHGARHVHEVRRNCEACAWTQTEAHVCNDAKNCDPCRADSRGPLGERPCERCYRSLKATEVVGVTTYCPECNFEAGVNHLCGKTTFCLTCLREAGDGHVHDATRLCTSCQKDVAIDHQCGTTFYCRACHRDAGPEHKHGETVWCYRCEAERQWPHHYHIGD